jgi:hypothetical protein
MATTDGDGAGRSADSRPEAPPPAAGADSHRGGEAVPGGGGRVDLPPRSGSPPVTRLVKGEPSFPGRKSANTRRLGTRAQAALGPDETLGSVQAAVVKPSKMLMLSGTIMCFLCLIGICYTMFPLIVSEEWRKQADGLKAEELTKLEPAETAFLYTRMYVLAGCVVVFVLSGLWVFGAVKMASLESHTWGLVGSIIAILVLLGVIALMALTLIGYLNCKEPDIGIITLWIALTLAGVPVLLIPIWCIRTLYDPKVKEAVAHDAEEVQRRG